MRLFEIGKLRSFALPAFKVGSSLGAIAFQAPFLRHPAWLTSTLEVCFILHVNMGRMDFLSPLAESAF